MHHYNCLNITAKDMTMQAFTLRHLVYACCLAAVSVLPMPQQQTTRSLR